MQSKIFVYGTLKRGQRNHRLLADQLFLAEATTEPRYRVYDLGAHPGLRQDDRHGLAVNGEVFTVSACCLEVLDDFEDVPHSFVRERIRIPGYEDVWAYFLAQEPPVGTASGNAWPRTEP